MSLTVIKITLENLKLWKIIGTVADSFLRDLNSERDVCYHQVKLDTICIAVYYLIRRY